MDTGRNYERWLFWGVLICAVLLSLKKISDVDALLHLDMGKLFWTLKGFPRTEPFCYPAAGQPFLYTSWLFALTSYLVWSTTGVYGLSLAVVAAVVALTWVLLQDARFLAPERSRVLAILAVFAALMLAEDRFILRPELVLYLAFSLSVWLLGRYALSGEKRGIWALPLICLLWANSHSSITLMVVPFGAFTLYCAVEWLWPAAGAPPSLRDEMVQRLKVLLGLLAVSFLAALCNPNFIGQFQYGQAVMSTAWYKQGIVELLPPDRHELVIIWPLFAGSFILSILALRRRALPYLLISVALLAVALQAVRFFEFFCLMQAPLLARSVAILVPSCWQERFRGAVAVGVVGVLMLTAAGLKAGSIAPFKRDVLSRERFGFGYNLQVDHGQAVAFLQKHQIKGRVFNIFEDGQSIIWHGWPDLTVYIDGRGALPEEALNLYSQAFAEPKIMKLLQDRYGFEVVLLGRNQAMERNPHGSKGFFHNPDWAMVYFDGNSYLFLRKAGPFSALVQREEFRYLFANAGMEAYLEFMSVNPDYARGLASDLERGLGNSATEADRVLLGYSYYRAGNAAKAVEVLGPVRNDSSFSLLAYGHALKALGRIKEATAIYQQGVDRFGSNDFVQARQSLDTAARVATLLEQGGAALSRGDRAGARQAFEAVLQEDRGNPAALANLGYCALDEGNFVEAERLFQQALAKDSTYDVALYGMGLTWARQGQRDRAKEGFRRYMQVQKSGPYFEKAKAYVESLP